MNTRNSESLRPSIYPEAVDLLRDLGVRHLTRNELDTISNGYREELLKGIHYPGTGSLAMLDTGLEPFDPKRVNPKHNVLVVEIGGTNTRAALVGADNDGNIAIQRPQETQQALIERPVPGKIFSNPQDFIREMFTPVEEILNGNRFDGIGFVFSFPGIAEHTDHGVDVVPLPGMSKGFSVRGIDSGCIGQILIEVLKAKCSDCNTNFPQDPRIAVMNDTVAVLKRKWGGVVATGLNFAYSYGNIYNSESGKYTGIPPTVLSESVDRESSNPGEYRAEKQISGMYIGESIKTVGRILQKELGLPESVRENFTSSEDISRFLGKDPPSQTLYERINKYAQYYAALEAASALLRYRSAQIVGTMVGSAVSLDPGKPFEEVRIPIEGSFFWGTPGYKEMVQREAVRYSGRPIQFQQIPHAGILGAAGHVFNMLY